MFEKIAKWFTGPRDIISYVKLPLRTKIKDITVSTVELPLAHDDNWYETCAFRGSESEVVTRYKTLNDAVVGHFIAVNQTDLYFANKAAEGFTRELDT